MYKRYPVQPARRNPKPPPGFKASSLVLLSALLVLPGLALHRLSHGLSHHLDWRLAADWMAAISVVTYMLYRTDKRRAQAGDRRKPEALLHLLELAGGWPAAFVAQRTLGHKISKLAFQATSGLIVLLHQYAAADFLLEWRISGSLLQLAQVLVG